MINAASLALGDIFSPPFRGVLAKSLALTIGLLELTGRARAMQEFSFKVFEAFTAATVIYLLTNLVVVLLMRALENKVRVPGLIAAGGAPQAGH